MKMILKNKVKQDISKYPKRQQLYYVYRTIINRRNFEYTLKNLFSYFFLCRNCSKREKLWRGPAKRDLYLNRAIVKLNKDMGVMDLLFRAHIVKEMQQILFNKSDRMLMQMQKRRVIDSATTSSEEHLPENQKALVNVNPDNLRRVFSQDNEGERAKFRYNL